MRSDVLVAAGTLRSALGTAPAAGGGADRPVVLDVRWSLGGPPGARGYAAGHLPGASFVDLDTVLAGRPGPAGRHPLPDPERFAAALRAAGVCTARRVVVYDADGGYGSARAWWCLRYFGHARVRVLDGGLAAWVRTGGALTRVVPSPEPGDFVAVPGGLSVLDASGAARLAASGVLLDARAAERYRGEVEPLDPVAGHIPGARSAPAASWRAADGRLASAAQVAAGLRRLGVDAGAPVGYYCGSGVSAALGVLALAVAGVDAALYVGSWSNWCAEHRPVATGPG